MSVHFGIEPFTPGKVAAIVVEEREKSLSGREWMHRIAGYGLSVKETEDGQIITSLSTGEEICALPNA